MYKKIFNRLPERFKKQNTEKLYYVLFDEKGAFFNAINSVEDSRNIDKAAGNTLDLLGANVGQVRQGEDDDLYRQLIKVRILANMSIGDIPTINTVVSTLVKDVYLGLKEMWGDTAEPAAISLKLDFNYFGKHIQNVGQMVSIIKAAGVRVIFDTSVDTNLYTAQIHRKQLDLTYPVYQPTDIIHDINLLSGINASQRMFEFLKVASEDLIKDKYGNVDHFELVGGE